MSLSDIREEIRFHLADQKTRNSVVVDEKPATGKNDPFDTVDFWNATATGTEHEEFLVKNMPMVSGCQVRLRGGRWNYTHAGQFPDDYGTHTGREFLVDYHKGIFYIPSGATPIPSGIGVKLTYTWEEDQEYAFSDNEINTWIAVGDAYLRDRLSSSIPYTITGIGSLLQLAPVPSGTWAHLLALSTSYFMRMRLMEEDIQAGIILKQGSTAFNTTATLVHRGRSLEHVRQDLVTAVKFIKMSDLNSAGYRIDTYSTYQTNPETGIGSSQESINTGSVWRN